MGEHRIGLYVTLAALAALIIHRRGTRQKVNHPPSPTSLPLLGNILAMPSGPEHLAYLKLSKELNSDIIFLELLGNHIIVLNSAEAASDLLEKRSALYSGRVCPPVIKDPELFDWSTSVGMIYNDVWRHHRRVMNHWLNVRAVTQFNDIQERQTRQLLRRLLDVSERSEPFEHVKDEFCLTMASTMLQLAYGYRVNGQSDPFFANFMEAIHNTLKAIMFTNFYVNLFPALARVPDWLPGTGWKQTIRTWRDQRNKSVNEPFEWTRAQVDAGVAEPSMIGALLQEHSLTSGLSIEERDSRLKELGNAIFTGGTDTTATALVNLVAAMVKNPHVQAKAQQEIDTVLGPDTLPTMSDQARLPYVNNLILELSRWRPVVPTAVPHVCLQDDVYRGYDIMKDTIVIGNVWAISHDETVYPDPEVFNPDRFLDPTVPHPPVFGWGRRKCPGLHFGEASLFIAVTSLLSAYTFSKAKDASGTEIEPVLEDAPNSLVLGLKPFGFEFKPRSDRHRRLVQDLA